MRLGTFEPRYLDNRSNQGFGALISGIISRKMDFLFIEFFYLPVFIVLRLPPILKSQSSLEV